MQVQYLLRHETEKDECQPQGGTSGKNGITKASRIHYLVTMDVDTNILWQTIQ